MNADADNKIDPRRQKIQIIQVLRAAAAIVVFMGHFFAEEFQLPGLHFWGRVGVGIFFVISGYLLVYTDKEDMKGYLSKRIIRICPLYWSVTLAVFFLGLIAPSLLHTSVSTVPNLIKSFLFIPYWSGESFYPLLPVGWTLIIEMFVYLLYYIISIITTKLLPPPHEYIAAD